MADSRPIYLDYHATTPTDPRVAAVVLRYLVQSFGNASSTDHTFGDEASDAVAHARSELAALLQVVPRRVVFTSGATESINLAIKGFLERRSAAGRARLVVSPTEHSAVLDTCAAAARSGHVEVTFLAVDQKGRLDICEVEDACTRADLLCVMAANNEVGTVHPVPTISQLCQRYGVAYLCDATQAAGKIPLDASGIAFTALSAHKFYGPKGCGALILAEDALVAPQLHGGGHQRSIRSGTLNVPGIAGLGEAARLRRLEMAEDESRIGALRDKMQSTLLTAIRDLSVNGAQEQRLAGNLHVSVPGVPGGAIIARVRDRLAISTGSACSSGTEAPSHVLRALGLPVELVEGALRIGLGKFTTDEDASVAIEILADAVTAVRLCQAEPRAIQVSGTS